VIGALASARHVPVAPHHSTGLGVAIAAGLHVAAALEDVPFFEYQPTTVEVANRVLRTPLTVDAGSMTLPSGPGLGVEVDPDVVLKYAEEV
jgi:D-galactarolactone cycloisomerase